jgi:quinol-cytochrome oxidoreductase complex cytochrome b subunit
MSNKPSDDVERDVAQNAERETEQDKRRFIPFFPDYLLDETIAWYTGLAVLIVLASLFPAGLENEANPLSTPEHIKPEWYFLFLFEFLKLVPRTVGVLAPGVLVVFLLLVPFLDRKPERMPRSRPVTLGLAALLLVCIIILGIWGWRS